MKKVNISLYLLFALLFSFSFRTLSAQNTPQEKGLNEISVNVLSAQLGFLASDWMEGRRAGEKGELLSSDYISSMLSLYGVKPFGDRSRFSVSGTGNAPDRSWFQTFILQRITPGDDQSLKLITMTGSTEKIVDFTNNVDFSLRPSSNVTIKGPVVFVGYGFRNSKVGFDDIGKTDLKGKFILRIAGTPAFANSKLTRAEITASMTELERLARESEAAGIIDITSGAVVSVPARVPAQNMSPSENSPRPSQVNSRLSIPSKAAGNEMLRLTVSLKTANDILLGTGNNIEEYIKKADSNQAYQFRPLPERFIEVKTSAVKSLVQVRNIIGIIEGKKPDEFIVLGAHYDHMGMNDGYIWNGADDNGSGTVGVMTIAKAIMGTGVKPEKSVIIALWTAEEEGLLGSRYFVANPGFPKDQIKLNVNFDMISRYISDDKPDKVVMTYTASKSSFRDLTATNLKKHNISLDVEYQPSDDPPGGSDHRSFVAAGIPVMRFKPGHREEYHTPADEVSTIDWDIMEKIVKISFLNTWELANTDW
jgi:Zn-dependent M28 family amino/carboxypeptidase